MKKWIAVLLTAAMLLCAAPLTGFTAIELPEWDFGKLFPTANAAEIVDSGNCGEVDEENGLDGSQVTWTLDSDGLLTISGRGEMESYSWNGSPWYYNSAIQTVVIQDDVTNIGDHAFFDCAGITSVTIGNGVTSIGRGAFDACDGLTQVTIPDSVTSIGENAFANSAGLTNVTIGNGVTSIGTGAFSYCTGLFSVSIPDSVTSIGWLAFSKCPGLTALTVGAENPVYFSVGNCIVEKGSKTLVVGCKNSVIPDDGSVTNIGNSAFNGCTEMTQMTIPASVTSIDGYAFEGCTGLTSVTIGNGVTSIGPYAFSDCAGLTSVTIPNGVASIWNAVFDGCTGLTSVIIPASVTSIDGSAFRGCTGLTNLTVDAKNPVYFSAGNCIIEKDSKTLVIGCDNSVIPVDGSVTSIGASAFSQCAGLTSLTIPDGVTSIEIMAFSDCTGLTSVMIPDSVTSIEIMAFSNCTALTSVTIPDSVMRISHDAFKECTGLTNLTVDTKNPVYFSAGNCVIEKKSKTLVFGCNNSAIPKDGSVTGIGNEAFSGCKELTQVTIPDSVTSIGNNAFSGCSKLSRIYYTGTQAQWEAVKNDSGKTPSYFDCLLEDGIVYNHSKTMIQTVYDLTIRQVVIPDSVTSIGENAFKYCSRLTSVTIPESVKRIGNSVFYGCTSLTNVTIPDGVTSIGDYAFYRCTSLESVTIPDSVTSIENYAFHECTSLKSVTIPDSVTTIGTEAFYKCEGLERLTIGKGVSKINFLSFCYCDSLSEVTVSPDNPVYFSSGNCLIEKEKKLLVLGCKNSVIPADGSVTTIGELAFSGNEGLSSIIISDAVTCINSNAFYKCTGLTSIVIPATVTEIYTNFMYGETIPQQAVIYGYVGSYAQTWAEEQGNTFMAIRDATITLNAPAIVNEPTVKAYGFANPGAAVVCFVNGKETATVQASANCRWSAEIPLTGAKDGDSFEIKATVTLDGKTAEKTAKVTYKPDAVVFQKFTMSHQCYSISIDANNLGVGKKNITFIPGNPLAFKIKVTNNDRINKLYVVSSKDGSSKKIELTYDKDSGYWFANGFFDDADKNYVPGKLTITGVDKDGKEFDAGVTVKINFLIDPSGYVYEAVLSNKLEGVTAAVYYKDAQGHELLWNAETADQLNPITTLADGAFAWVVPEGQWQVRLTKEGYLETRSEWMDVPPEQTNIYIGMASNDAPEVAYCNIYADRAEITFSQYMDLAYITADNVKFDGYTGTFTPLDKTETDNGSDIFYAKTFAFTPDKAFAGEVNVKIENTVNYIGTVMNTPYTATFTVAAEPKNLTAQDVSVKYGETAEMVISAENAAGKTVSVACDSAIVTLSAKTLTLDETGKATLTVTGDMPGTANLTFALNGTTLTTSAIVTIAMPEKPAEPAFTPGDVDGNGKVESSDARLALRASVHLSNEPTDVTEGSAGYTAADYNKNGTVESSDARCILRVAVKLDPFG